MRLLQLTLALSLTTTLACGADADQGPDGEQADDQGSNLSSKPLSFADQERIIQQTGDALFTPDEVPEASFVIHDTAGATSESYMRDQAQKGRGPLGAGPQVWIAKTAATFVGRPFFDAARPSATVYEKVGEMLEAAEIASLGRALWAGVTSDDRDNALTNVLAELAESFPGEAHRMTPSEIMDEVLAARELLEAADGKLYTTAMWTVQFLLEEGKIGNLDGEQAATLQSYYDARDERIGASLNVEIAQIAGSNCLTGEPLQPYSDAIYENIATTYLQSALVAGFYPETTTHFAIDAAHRGHCDPRCFELDYFYSVVAEQMGHPKGTRYGDAAKYGTVYGQHNVWWDEGVCGGVPRSL